MRARAERAAQGVEEDEDGTDEWCPEVRIADARESRLQQEAKEKARDKSQVGRGNDFGFGDQPRERRFFKDDGTPIQMNTAKWPFSIEEDSLNVYVDVALPKFLDSAMVGVCLSPSLRPVLPSAAPPAGR